MSEYDDTVPVCDYEGSDYRTRFWVDKGREYEDLCERIAIRHLLPPQGRRLLEIGTGFGRLVDLYQGYEQIVLLDYSKSMLCEAQERLGTDPRYTYVAANVYQLPFADNMVDGISMVRVIHHLVDVPAALAQIARVLEPGGSFLLEFASKLHLKSVLRYLFRRQDWSPFERQPVEFVPLNFDFHPRWMRDQLELCGFCIEKIRTLSHFRVPLLKKTISARVLAALDGLLQPTGAWWQLAPSLFYLAQHGVPSTSPSSGPLVFRCPACGSSDWQPGPAEMQCRGCGARWSTQDGIYDFKNPL